MKTRACHSGRDVSSDVGETKTTLLAATVVYPTQHEISIMLEMSSNHDKGMKIWCSSSRRRRGQNFKKRLIGNVIHRNRQLTREQVTGKMVYWT